ncbi:hypothetical protein V6N13_097158 [Hibiscus sabdariffa]|uniref:MYB-CC type transcription factor LHEQLE-containing domain-containing protein n=1 Tax=Hibiscus sabdariffa TaxID=183260 RepID=A0ABR2BYI1_9ROSI
MRRPSRSDGFAKERLRWTQELHDRFEEAVNQLGGPDSKSSQALLGFMGDGVYVNCSYQGRRLREFSRLWALMASPFTMSKATCRAAQLNEALQLHIAAQRKQGDDKLEVRRNLKIKIEAQARYFKRISGGGDHSNRFSPTKATKSSSPVSLPSLCDESESYIKDPEANSEAGVAEDNSTSSSSIYTFASSFHPDAYEYNDISAFPWNIPVCSSPLVPNFM